MEEVKSIPIPGKSRNLLHKGSSDLTPADENPYGITVRPPMFWQQAQTPSVANVGVHKDIIDDISLDDDNKKNSVKSDPTGKEKVVYVQIEQSMEESNITYVANDDYKTDHNYDGPLGADEAVEAGGKKRKRDLWKCAVVKSLGVKYSFIHSLCEQNSLQGQPRLR